MPLTGRGVSLGLLVHVAFSCHFSLVFFSLEYSFSIIFHDLDSFEDPKQMALRTILNNGFLLDVSLEFMHFVRNITVATLSSLQASSEEHMMSV